jgi:hypothetical protein
MAITATLSGSLSITVKGDLKVAQFIKDISTGGEVHETVVNVGTETTTKVFDITTSTLSSFDVLWIESDKDVYVEFVVDDGNNVGEEVWAQKLRAGTAIAMPYDDAKANYTVNFAGGSDDVVETVRVRNESTTDTASVRLIVIGT